MPGVSSDDGMVLQDLRNTLRSLFEGPTKRYTYEEAWRKTDIVPSRLHTLAQCSAPVRIDDLPELLIALEKLDPELFDREEWFARFVDEDRLRLESDRPRTSQAKHRNREGKPAPMPAMIGNLDGERFSSQAAVIGANRIRVEFFRGAFSKTTVIRQPLHVKNLTIVYPSGAVPSDGDWARLESDLDPLWRGSLTPEQIAYLERCSYELPHLRQTSRSLAEWERLLITRMPEQSGLALVKGTVDRKRLETALERTTMKEMTERNLPNTIEVARAICGNPNGGIDVIIILQYNTAKNELHVSYFSPIAFCDESRRPNTEIDFDGLIKRATPSMEDFVTTDAAGEPEYLLLHEMRVALMQLHQADLKHGLVEIFAYLNFKGDRREITEENAVRYNPEISEAYRKDKSLGHAPDPRARR
jgi:hypothetical protein